MTAILCYFFGCPSAYVFYDGSVLVGFRCPRCRRTWAISEVD